MFKKHSKFISFICIFIFCVVYNKTIYAAPGDFNLYSPTGSVIVETQLPTLEWEDTTDGETFSFTVYYSTSPDFSIQITSAGIPSNTTTYVVPSNLIENATYWWNVYAENQSLERTYASTETFRVNWINENPTNCVVTAPINHEVVLTRIPTFYYQRAEDPDPGDTFEYKVHVSLDPDIQDWAGSTYVSEQLYWSIEGWAVLDENATYYWFVRVRDRAAGDDPLYWPQSGYPWYDIPISTFHVNGTPENPTVPSLSAPPNGGLFTDADGTPDFSWLPSTDPDPLETITYTVRYSSAQAEFDAGIYTASSTLNTTFTPTAQLIDNVTYWWSVQAVDDSAQSLDAVSSTWTLITSYIPENPNPFDLLLIADTTTTYDLTPTLTWEETTDPDPGDSITEYRILYTVDPLFASYTEASAGTSTAYTIPSNLQLAVTYYWIVRAYSFQPAGGYTVSNSTFSFYTNNNSPAAFSLVKSSGIITTTDPELEWTASADPDAAYGDSVDYTVYYAQNLNDLTTPNGTSYADILTTTYTVTSLQENATYYWTVRAYDQNNYFTGTSTWTLRINAANEPPSSFDLVSPQNIVDTATPVFDWEDTTDPDPGDSLTYTIWYSSYSNFSVYTSSAGLADSAYTPSAGLDEDTTYWWSVRAVDNDAGAQTVSDSTFTIIINAVNQQPSGFNLVSPSNGSISPTRYPIFIWDEATDGDPGDSLAYTIYYSTNIIFDVVTSSAGLIATTYTPQSQLIENATYYWYAKVQDTQSAENFSQSTWTVIINGTNEFPVAFDLISPADGQLVYDRSPSFDWQDSYDPDPISSITYRLHYSIYSDFSSSTTISNIDVSNYTFGYNLEDNLIYYWKVDAVDSSNNITNSTQSDWSFILNVSNEAPQTFDLISPADEEVVFTGKPLFDWEDSSDPDPLDTITYRLVYSLDPNLQFLSTEVTGIAVSEYTSVVTLQEQTSYYWTAYASDGDFEVPATSTHAFYIEADNGPPSAFSLITPENGSVFSTRSIDFDWEDSSDSDYGDVITYELAISEYADFSTSYTVSGLSNSNRTVANIYLENNVYYWKVTVKDTEGLTRDSDQTRNFYIPIIDIPRMPENLRGVLSDDWQQFVIYWDDVTVNEDASAYVDPGGYNIYRSQQLKDLHAAAVYAHVGAGVEFYQDTEVNGGLYYYLVRSIDTSGNESDNSTIVASSPEKSIIVLSDDGEAYMLIFPKEGDDSLDTYRFAIERVPADETERVLGSYQFKAYIAATDEEADGLKIQADARAYFYYSTMIQRALSRNPQAQVLARQLGIFWHNGVEYVKCGGTINNSAGIISLDTKRLGPYRVQQVLRATSFELVQIWPTKTFTPNGDGINDEINFNFENPKESVVTGKIFDITGGYVADLKTGLNGSWSLLWDGKDRSGSYAPKGVYIYQIEADGKIINGTIIVAR
ncbi:MAG: hypothetical protein ABII23_02995 [bacterium]